LADRLSMVFVAVNSIWHGVWSEF